MNEQVNRFANALMQAALDAGHHVSVMLPNCLGNVHMTWLALAKWER